jgi:hypothetical protein
MGNCVTARLCDNKNIDQRVSEPSGCGLAPVAGLKQTYKQVDKQANLGRGETEVAALPGKRTNPDGARRTRTGPGKQSSWQTDTKWQGRKLLRSGYEVVMRWLEVVMSWLEVVMKWS